MVRQDSTLGTGWLSWKLSKKLDLKSSGREHGADRAGDSALIAEIRLRDRHLVAGDMAQTMPTR